MRTRRFGRGIFVCALLSATYGVADAQTTKANPSDTSVGMQRQVNLTPQEQLAQADAFVARMGVTGASVRRMLEQARSQRDVVKTLCLNDKLNQIDVAIRSGQDRRVEIRLDQQVAWDRREIARSDHPPRVGRREGEHARHELEHAAHQLDGQRCGRRPGDDDVCQIEQRP